MKLILLSIFSFFTILNGFCTTHTITNSGFSFTPSTITIMSGDDVNFDIENIHEVREVSQATWNANGNTALPGGFSTGFGGGMIPASMLTVGTHWYVCVPHASGGMKGMIIVQATTATEEIQSPTAITVFPNPSNGKFQVILTTEDVKNYDVEIFNILGVSVFSKSKEDMQAINEVNLTDKEGGVYLLRIRDGLNVYTRKIVIQRQ